MHSIQNHTLMGHAGWLGGVRVLLAVGDAVLPGGVTRETDAVYLSNNALAISRRLIRNTKDLMNRVSSANATTLANLRRFTPAIAALAPELAARLKYAEQLSPRVGRSGADAGGDRGEDGSEIELDRGRDSPDHEGRRHVLVIGVISARHHFDKRQAIRETWGNPVLLAALGVQIRFVVGAESCRLPPDRRVSVYACDREAAERYIVGRAVRAHDVDPAGGDTATSAALQESGIRAIGLDFTTKHWISVTRLGILVGDAVQRRRRWHAVSVTLWDTDAKAPVLNLTLAAPTATEDCPGAEVVGGIAFLPVPRGVVLPEGFSGTVSAAGYDAVALLPQSSTNLGKVIVDDGGGLLSLARITRTGTNLAGFPDNIATAFGAGLMAATLEYRMDLVRESLLHSLEWMATASYEPTRLFVGDQLQLKWGAGEPLSVFLYASQSAWNACTKAGGRALDASDDGPGRVRVLLRDLPIGDHFLADPRQCGLGHMRLRVIVSNPVADHAASLAWARGEPVAVDAAWLRASDAADARLAAEALLHGDILTVPGVDTYRGVPSKVLEFYRWAAGVRAPYAMKTDDDCFVDIGRIVAGLTERGLLGRSHVWWSQFREGWPVARQGKWAERDYSGTAYPAFACGAGGVLSLDLVDYLALNADTLFRCECIPRVQVASVW